MVSCSPPHVPRTTAGPSQKRVLERCSPAASGGKAFKSASYPCSQALDALQTAGTQPLCHTKGRDSGLLQPDDPDLSA